MNTDVLDILIIIIASLLVAWWVACYQIVTRVPAEFQYITEKISSYSDTWKNCILYKTYQVCEEGKRCGWEKKLKHPVYTTICNDGQTKIEEHIVRIQ